MIKQNALYDDLNKLVLSYKIFFDTSSLLCERSELFFCNTLHPILLKHSKHVFVPKKVFWDAKTLQQPSDEKMMNSFRRVTNILNLYLKFDLIDIRADKDEPLSDDAFVYIFSQLRNRHNICLITQNSILAHNVYTLMKPSRFVKTNREIIVFHLSRDGKLAIFPRIDFEKEVTPILKSDSHSMMRNQKRNIENSPLEEQKINVASKTHPTKVGPSICTYGTKIRIYNAKITKTKGITPPSHNDIEKLRYYIGKAEEKGEDHEVTYWDKLREIQIDALDFTEHRLGKVYENLAPLLRDANIYWSQNSNDENSKKNK